MPQDDINRYFLKDNSRFHIMVRNVTNPGPPYGRTEQLVQIRKIMEYGTARDNILANRSRGRLAMLNRMLCPVGSRVWCEVLSRGSEYHLQTH